VNGQGDAVAVWSRPGDGVSNDAVQAATRPAGGSWSPPVEVSSFPPGGPCPCVNGSPQVALDGQGNAVAVWDAGQSPLPDGTRNPNRIIQASTRAPGGRWSSPVPISSVGLDSKNPHVAVDGQGEAVAVWRARPPIRLPFVGPNNGIIQTATRTGGNWSESQNLTRADQTNDDPSWQ
jgi:hypothetical protein